LEDLGAIPHGPWQVTQQTNRPREGGKRVDVEFEMFFNRFSGNHQPGKSKPAVAVNFHQLESPKTSNPVA